MTNMTYPAEYIREMSIEAFEIVITRLKALELEDLAEAADAAFLVWQLADDNGPIAQQTICETLPILINLIYRSNNEE